MTAVATEPTSASAGVAKPDEHVVVLFGATGDLARRKLLPGLFHLYEAGLLPDDFRIVGTARSGIADDEFRARARAAVDEFGRTDPDEDAWDGFARRLSFAASDANDATDLAARVRAARTELGGNVRLLHYLSVPPVAFGGIAEALGRAGLTDGARVIMEKPFGTDLDSSRTLNDTVHGVFAEEQIFRIDHFLGKEAVQNLLALRFANGMFEPIWNRTHVEHVQIDVPETLSIGSRAGFYEGTGAFRDMVVTHLFQVLGFVAMEPPTSLRPEALRAEKVKVFEAMRPLDPTRVVRGQYEGYRAEPGVAPDSETETFVALECFVDNWRWKDVPFYVRTGKSLAAGKRVLTVALREPALSMFEAAGGAPGAFGPNRLTIDLGDPGAISASFRAKVPGATMELGQARMDFRYADSFCTTNLLEAYERLIHDAMVGDRTLFTSAAGIERLWEVSASLLETPPPVEPYARGSWGPEAIDRLIAPRRWQLPAGTE